MQQEVSPTDGTVQASRTRQLQAEATKLFADQGLTAPSVRMLADELIKAGELDMTQAIARIGRSRTALRRAAKRLSRLRLRGRQMCVIEQPGHCGRGYRLILRCPVKLRPLGENSRSGTHTQTTSTSTQASTDAARPREATENHQPTAAARRRAVLDALDDNVTLVHGARYYRYVAERIRRGAWSHGAARPVSDALVGTVMRSVAGRTMGEYRQIAATLNAHGNELIRRLNAALRRGIRAVYRACRAILKRLLAGQSMHDRTPSRGSSRGFDLNEPWARRRFLRAVQQVAMDGGGPCPRCGRAITRFQFVERPGAAYDDASRYCTCVYVARERELADLGARE